MKIWLFFRGANGIKTPDHSGNSHGHCALAACQCCACSTSVPGVGEELPKLPSSGMWSCPDPAQADCRRIRGFPTLPGVGSQHT